MAELLAEAGNQATPARREPKVGQLVKGTVVKLGSDAAFVDIGYKSEAVLDLGPLRDETGKPQIAEGDEVEAHVVSVGGKGGAVVLSKALVSGPEIKGLLGQAQESGLPVEGLVTAVNKGGIEVSVGGLRAFCPLSQIEVRFVESPQQYVGRKLRFRVTKIDDSGRNVVLSRRALLEEENKSKAEEVREKLVEGATVRGTVTSIRDYGAFVDLGAGIEGLLHVSELSFGHVGHPSEILKTGQEVDVQVLKIEAGPEPGNERVPAPAASGNQASPGNKKAAKRPKEQKISLSLKALVQDPWASVAERFVPGSKAKGKVVRLQPFGAFVELAPGIDGLIHVSQLADRRIAHPKDVVKVGQEIEATIVAVDLEKKRIGLSMLDGARPEQPGAEGASEPREPRAPQGERRGPRPATPRPEGPTVKIGDILIGKVAKVEAFGIFIKLENGLQALVPNVEMGTPFGTDHKKMFPEGTDIRALVIGNDRGKLRMSKKGALEADERADMTAYNATQVKSSGPGFGTFADLLKAKTKR